MPTLTPYLIVDDGDAAIRFYEAGLGAICKGRVKGDDSGKLLNAMLDVDGVAIMLMDEFPDHVHPNGIRSLSPKSAGGGTAAFHFHCADAAEVDARYARLMAAGGVSATAPQVMFWGDYYASAADPFGHQWSFGTPHIEARR